MAATLRIDLSRFPSDGSFLNWPSGARYTMATDSDESRFLRRLSAAENATHAPGAPRVEIVALPRGYRLFAEARNNTTNRAVNYLLYGHPNGYFNSAPKAFVHFCAITQRSLATCACVKCNRRAQATAIKPFWQLSV